MSVIEAMAALRRETAAYRDGLQAADPAISLTAFCGLLLCLFGFWALQHPYGGLIQDSVLYAFGAFARLHPESLAQDVYLGHGTQDQYTLFSPLVAEVIRWIGVARAAALVTAVSHAALYCSAGLLARRLMPARVAILAVALLALLPSLFGAKHIFWYTEDLMTPRVPAEALVFAALACALGTRYVLAVACLLGAMLLHPLMALAGVVMMFMLFVGLPWPRLAAVTALGGLAVVVVVACVAPFGPVARFDPVWFGLLHERLQYAFPSLWSLQDWGRMSVAFSTLAAGAASSSPSTARTVCRAALLTALSGMALALFGSDLLHVVIVAQIQPWRWLWISNAVAVLVIPVIAAESWHAGFSGRVRLALLAAAWMSFEQTFVPVITLSALASVALGDRSFNDREKRWMLLGCGVVLAVASLFFVKSVLTGLRAQPPVPAGMTFFESAYWAAAHQLKPWTVGGILPAAAFWAIWHAASRHTDRRTAFGVVLLGAAICVALAPFTWSSWSDPAPSEPFRARFESWRREIPPTAQVLGPGVPLIPWFLLERSSYWSLRQMAGAIYSRATAMELVRRETLVDSFPPAPKATRILEEMCHSDPLIGYVVTPVNMGPTPFAPVSLADDGVRDVLYLYRCADHRRPSSTEPSRAPSR